nr:hypothetical protein Iba_chr01cCG3850 [Ipomoea batatas]
MLRDDGGRARRWYFLPSTTNKRSRAMASFVPAIFFRSASGSSGRSAWLLFSGGDELLGSREHRRPRNSNPTGTGSLSLFSSVVAEKRVKVLVGLVTLQSESQMIRQPKVARVLSEESQVVRHPSNGVKPNQGRETDIVEERKKTKKREGRISSIKKLEDFHLSILVSHAIVRFAKVEQVLHYDLALQPLVHDRPSVHVGMSHTLLMDVFLLLESSQCILPGRPQLLSRLRKAFLFRSQTSAQLSQVSLDGLHLLKMSRLCGPQKFRVLSQTLDGLVSDLEKLRLENTTKGE